MRLINRQKEKPQDPGGQMADKAHSQQGLEGATGGAKWGRSRRELPVLGKIRALQFVILLVSGSE